MPKRKKVLDEPTLLKLRLKMVKHASISRHPHPEDIASEYVVGLLQGLHAHQTIGQAYIDIVRRVTGRKGSPGYEFKLSMQMVPKTEKQANVVNLLEDVTQGLSVDQRIDLKKALGQIENERTKVILAKVLAGWGQQEIADEYGLTLSRINQIINRELAWLSAHFNTSNS